MLPKYEMRRIALSAARASLRNKGIDPMDVQAYSGLAALDDLCRTDTDTLAAVWYENASENQIILFKREWRKWQRFWRESDVLHSRLDAALESECNNDPSLFDNLREFIKREFDL